MQIGKVNEKYSKQIFFSDNDGFFFASIFATRSVLPNKAIDAIRTQGTIKLKK